MSVTGRMSADGVSRNNGQPRPFWAIVGAPGTVSLSPGLPSTLELRRKLPSGPREESLIGLTFGPRHLGQKLLIVQVATKSTYHIFWMIDGVCVRH